MGSDILCKNFPYRIERPSLSMNIKLVNVQLLYVFFAVTEGDNSVLCYLFYVLCVVPL